MPRLLVNPGTPQQWELPLKDGTHIHTVGRSPSCDLQIPHESVSGTHCEISATGSTFSVRDLGSTNGTFLNQEPIQQCTLQPGQRFQVGSVEVEFALDTAPPAPVAAPVAPTARRVAVRLASAVPPAPVTPIAPATPPVPSAAPPPSLPSPPPPPPPRSAVSLAAPRPALRVTVHDPPPPPPQSSLPPIVMDEYAAEATGPAMCKYHPKTLARYLCPQCSLHYCELCVTTRPGGTRTGWFCRRCSGECVALNVQLIREGAGKENFFAALPSAFVYPFQGKGLTFLICGTLLFAGLDLITHFMSRAYLMFKVWFILGGFSVAFIFAYVQRIIQTTAQGSDEQADWPDVSDFWEDILVPCFQLLFLAAVCLGPGIVFSALAVQQSLAAGGGFDPQYLVVIFAAFVMGALYYPMGFLSLAMFDSVAGLNPLIVVPAIFKIPLEYLTALLVTALIIGIGAAQQYVVRYLHVPVLPTVIATALSLYLLTVQGRMLGLMYYASRQKLGWFNLR